MMCRKPFVRAANVSRKETLLTDARSGATPFPCGQCLPCRINKAREWTHRIMLEASLCGDSSFVTLTYDNDHLPEDGSVSKAELQNYLKRLRRNLNDAKFRYFGVGEYGDKSGRPHYHLALFGVGSINSEAIAKGWDKCDPRVGISVGDISRDSARYISGYCVKKLTKNGDPRLNGRHPEFAIQSKMAGGLGIGAVRQIARQLERSPHWNPDEQSIIREIKYGKSCRMPLGRYLTQKLIEELGIKEEKVINELYEWQEDIFEKHCDQDESYYCSLVSEDEAKAYKQERKQKFFRQRKSL